MTKNLKTKIAIILLISIITPLLPIGQLIAYANDPMVTSITVYRTYHDLTGIGEYGINIRGTGLSRLPVRYMVSGGSQYIPLTNPDPGSDDFFRQYTIPAGQVISNIMVGNQDFKIMETNMPRITSVDPSLVDLSEDFPMVNIKGQNFSYFGDYNGTKTNIYIENKDVTDIFRYQTNEVYLQGDVLRDIGYGNKNIVIERTKREGSVDINIVYNHINALRIFESIRLDPRVDVNIFPNRGKIGSQTTITINGVRENYSIFFLENETDLFKYENLGENPEYLQTTEDKSIIKVTIPKGLTVGKTYKVVITNNLDNVKKPGLDLTNFVTKQLYIGDFYVVDASVGPTIFRVNPNQGTSAGSYLTIYGYRLEELKINDLVVGDNYVEDLEVLESGTDDPTRLMIKYDTSDMKYKDKEVVEATREFLVTIGRDALFERDHIGKQEFRPGDSSEDQLYVRTKTIDPADLLDPVKDVVVAITTIIKTADDETFEFTELAILERGYRFLPSYQDPTITNITPNLIQVEGESNPITKNTTIHSIEGQNFNVFRYNDGGEMKTNYPKVIIGGSSEENAQIIIEKDSQGKITYTTREGGEIRETTVEDAFLEVLDANGNIVTGIGGNEVGRFITFTIPEGLLVSANLLNTSLPIAVANPKRDSGERGIYIAKTDMIKFVTPTSDPTIESVEPNIVTVDGGEDIVVSGRDFREGIEVYIDGRKVDNVIRDLDPQSTRGILKFKAPKGREGINILQVMNPDGGSDTHPFIYVETLRIDPRITSITPPMGTEGDVIIIKGDNFLKPDPTVTDLRGMGMAKLLGTRVYLGNEEVNQYAEEGELVEYTAPSIINEPLMTVEKNPWTNIDELILTPYYKEARVEDVNGNTYILTRDRDGHIVFIGKDITYTFDNDYSLIKATDGSTIYEVEQKDNELVLIGEDDTEHVFFIDYNFDLFSIEDNPHGAQDLKVAAYYDSIFLRDNTGRLYRIIKDQLNRITITDERENTYDIRIQDNEIIAVKGSQSYSVKVAPNHIEINGLTLDFVTPYYIDPATGIITGHRVRVITRNEIEIIVPEKQIAGFYDVKVENPDTKSYTVARGFEYTKPQIRPVIYYIDPAEGSVDGGYIITIYGENFGEKPEVRIDGVLVAAKDTKVDEEEYKFIKVLVPKYTGNIDTDFITDKKYVRVHVTSGGASTSRNDLFAYKLASSKPTITRINPQKGPTAGGNVVVIEGTDFRFYEPYQGNPPKAGETNFQDIDGDGKWTNYNSELEAPSIPLNDPTIKDYTHYVDSPVLPSIYFGNNKAKIVEFERIPGTETYRIMVLAPRNNTAGTVDVYLRNNDSGQSPNVKYTYEASNPTIVSINTDTGRRTGGEIKDLIATGYRGNQIRLIDEDGKEVNTTMYLVRFGEITNRHLTDTEDPNYGQIRGGKAKVDLTESGFTAEINGSKLTLTLKESNKEYTGEYQLASGTKYINLKTLKASDDTPYPGYELVKVERSVGRLIIDRGFSPKVEERVLGTLEILTPSYYRATRVDVTIVNPDGVSNKRPFTYVNPGSQPTITNILRDNAQPSPGDDGRSRIVQVKSKGGNEIRVLGTDFRPNATIYIGNNFLEIKPEFISENELIFTMPEVTDENKFNTWHVLTVVNEDKGEARSDRRQPPIYIVITESESSPEISSIEPNRGPVTGGTVVTITGKDFRNIMEGYEGENISVIFGDKEVKSVTYNNYDRITITVPSSSKPGPVTVRVKNPDGTLSEGVTFTYISKPSIRSISPNRLFTNDTETVVTIKGSMFQEGLRVILGGKLEDAKATDTVRYISGVKDGKNIEKVVIGGIEANVVEFVSEEEIKVTFPQATDLENTNIIIINPDGGISDPYDKFRYEIPIPTKPLVLEAIPGYETTVQLIWSKSDESILNRATRYEIYGRKTADRENTFIGTTTAAEFLVRSLEPNTQYTFMVRALNQYGASIDFATVTVKTLSLRQDDKLKEKEDRLKEEEKQLREYGKEEVVNGRYTITLGTKSFPSGAGTVDLTLSKYKNQNKITIAIPIELARKDNRLTIKDGTMTGVINIRDLYTFQVSRLDKGDENAYIRIHLDRSTGTHLPIGKRPASKAYDLYFDYIYGKNSTIKIDQLLRNGLLFLEQDTLTYPHTKNTSLYIYNVETGEYENINSTTTDILGKMKFILLSDR